MTIEWCKRNDHKAQVKRVNNGIDLRNNSKFGGNQIKTCLSAGKGTCTVLSTDYYGLI